MQLERKFTYTSGWLPTPKINPNKIVKATVSDAKSYFPEKFKRQKESPKQSCMSKRAEEGHSLHCSKPKRSTQATKGSEKSCPYCLPSTCC